MGAEIDERLLLRQQQQIFVDQGADMGDLPNAGAGPAAAVAESCTGVAAECRWAVVG